MAMGTTTTVVSAAAIVTAGRWVKDQPLSSRVVVGGGALVLGLALLGETNELLGRRVSQIVLLTAAFIYIPSIAYAAGLTKIKPPDWGFGQESPDTRKKPNMPNPHRTGSGGTARST